MAWNEPGRGNDNDPWRQGGKRGGDQQPPDLDKVFKDLVNQFKRALGGKPVKRNGNGDQPPRGPQKGLFGIGFGAIAAILVVIYVLSGIYIVSPQERAAVFQFGKFVKEVGPGPHWLPPIIRSKKTVDVESVHDSRHRNRMLTKDANIVFVELTVQYRIGNLENYLFNVVDPIYSLEEATDSAIRQVIGTSTLDEILTAQRAKIRDEIRAQLVETLELYKPGLLITDVAMQPARAPDEVKEAFDDAIKAEEDENRMIDQARAYRARVVPIAQGHAERLLADARAYARTIVLEAEGDVERFNAILPEYRKAPTVTRKRMYIDTIQRVMGDTTKIVVDSKGGNNVFYMPLDQILKEAEKAKSQYEQGNYNKPVAQQQSRTNAKDQRYQSSRRRNDRTSDRG